MLSRIVNRDILYLIFKYIEDKKIEIELVSLIIAKNSSRVAIGFIDNILFFASRGIAIDNM